MTTENYRVEELIRDTLISSSTLQNTVPMSQIYTAHITDILDPLFPCITMNIKEGDYLGDCTDDFSFDSMEIEITTDKIAAPKRQLDEIYVLIQSKLKNKRITNSKYALLTFGVRKPMTQAYWDEKKNKTLYKKTITYNLVTIKL